MGKDGGWITLVTATCQLLAAVAGKVYLGSDSRLLRKIERDASLLPSLPPPAKDVMEDLLLYEVNRHSGRRKRKSSRTLDRAALAALIFVAGVTAAIDFGFATLATNYGWGWWLPFGVVTLLGLILSLVGYGQLYNDPDEETAASGGAGAAAPAESG